MDLQKLKDQFVAELKADRKKTVVLSLLLVVAVVLAVRLAVTSDGKPARATAVTASAPPAPNLSEASAAGDLAALAHSSLRPGQRDAHREQYLRTLDRTIERDLFEPNAIFFPPSQIQPEAPPKTASAPTTQPAVTEEQLRRKFIEEQSRMLQLRTTVLSESPTAIINGRVLRVGDWISGFEVTAVTADSCQVRKEGVTVELNMEQ